MILEIALYCMVLMIGGMLVFKIAYSFYDSFKDKKPFEEIVPLPMVEKIVGRLQCPEDFYCYQSSHNWLSNREKRDGHPSLGDMSLDRSTSSARQKQSTCFLYIDHMSSSAMGNITQRSGFSVSKGSEPPFDILKQYQSRFYIASGLYYQLDSGCSRVRT